MKLFVLAIAFTLIAPFCLLAQKDKKIMKSEGSSMVATTSGNLKLYPNPAKTYLNLYVTWGEPQTFNVGVYDKYNTLIKEWKESVRKEYQHSLDVTQMAAGSYYILVTGSKDKLKGEFTVIKQ